MLLLLDLGNSSLHGALLGTNGLGPSFRIANQDLLSFHPFGETLEKHLGQLGTDAQQIDRVVYVSVVPSIEAHLLEACQTLGWANLKIDQKFLESCGFQVQAQGVGADRLITAWAGWQTYQKPLLVVDVGTALTFDLVGAGGVFLGGAILPGPGLANQALAWGAEGLEPVPMEWPDEIIGKNTTEAVQSGILFGYTSMVKAMSEKIATQTGGPLIRLLTGGWSEILDRSEDELGILHPGLTLEGLKMAAEKP